MHLPDDKESDNDNPDNDRSNHISPIAPATTSDIGKAPKKAPES